MTTFNLAPGYRTFKAYEAKVDPKNIKNNDILLYNGANVIKDDEDNTIVK